MKRCGDKLKLPWSPEEFTEKVFTYPLTSLLLSCPSLLFLSYSFYLFCSAASKNMTCSTAETILSQTKSLWRSSSQATCHPINAGTLPSFLLHFPFSSPLPLPVSCITNFPHFSVRKGQKMRLKLTDWPSDEVNFLPFSKKQKKKKKKKQKKTKKKNKKRKKTKQNRELTLDISISRRSFPSTSMISCKHCRIVST